MAPKAPSGPNLGLSPVLVSSIETPPPSPSADVAIRPLSPASRRTFSSQLGSDQKAARILGVKSVEVDPSAVNLGSLFKRKQQDPAEILLRKKALNLPFPRLPPSKVRNDLESISERRSEESERDREELILRDIRFDGALETDPQQRLSLDASKLAKALNLVVAVDVDSSHLPPRPTSSQFSDPFDLSLGPSPSRLSLESSSAEQNPVQSSASSSKASSVKSKQKQKVGRKSVGSAQISVSSSRRNSKDSSDIWDKFVDIEALKRLEWIKEPGKFMPSPQERESLIAVRKTMARLYALDLLTREIENGAGIPLGNFDIPLDCYQLRDTSSFSALRQASSSFTSAIRGKQLCKEYDQWAYDNGEDNLATLASNDAYRQYTESWQKVFEDYAPWAWNLPDGGQLSAFTEVFLA